MKNTMKKLFEYLVSFLQLCVWYALFVCVLGFVFDLLDGPDEAKQVSYDAEPTTGIYLETEETRQEGVDEPDIYAEPPAPYYFDEYGAMYNLVDGTYDEYYLDEDYVEEIETPDSSAFISISYHHYSEELTVHFRTSDEHYSYLSVSPWTWLRFKNADSKGTFFNDEIKGCYEYYRH